MTGRRHDQRSSTSRTMVLTALTALALPASAVVTAPILARVLEPDGRGELAAVLAPLALGPLIFSFGLPEAITYYVASKKVAVLSAARVGVIMGACGGLVALIVLVATSPLLLDRHEDVQTLFVVLALTLPVVLGLTMLRYVAQGYDRFDLVRRERWFSVVSRVALIGVLALAGHLTVTSAAWATHGTGMLALLLLFPILRAGGRRREPRADPRALARFGARTWIGTLSGVLVLRLDQALLVPLAGARELGYYAVAVSLAEIPLGGLYAIRDVSFTASADRRDPEFVARVARMVTLISVPACLAGVAIAPAVVPFAFGDAFSSATPMTQILFLAMVPSAVATVLSAALFASNRPGLVSIAQSLALVVTVAGLFALVPEIGAIGAAWTSLAAYTLAAAVMSVAIARSTPLRLSDCFVPRRGDLLDLRSRVARALRRG
jgi:O-antigen/teichoic acid export membrane protein